MRAPRFAALAVALATLSALLAGCSGGSTDDTATGDVTSDAALKEGRGAINGLLVDDVYRPIPGATVLLQGAGLTATTDDSGEFQFLDLLPASYVAITSAERHEAAPINVDVVVGQYADLEIRARRIFSENGRTITSEYSVFVPCAIDYVANGNVLDCTGDQSGDTFRAGYTSDYTPYNKTATYLIVEMKANKADRYEVQLREDNGDSGGGERYAVAQFEGDYLRMQFKVGETNTVYNGQDNNVPFNVTKPIALILFADSTGREEIQGVDPTGFICCGVGAHFGIKAKFIQTLFLGPPEVEIDHYCVLADSC